MDKEKLAQLIADYRDGKITAEEFSARRNDINGDGSPQSERPVADTSARSPMSTNTKILIGIGGGILLMLCVIAFLLFWNSPEQVSTRALGDMFKAMHQETQESVHEAHALRIITDLRRIKAAALMFFASNTGRIDLHDFFIGNTQGIVAKFGEYMDNPESLDPNGDYMIITLTDNTCFIKKLLSQTPVEVRKILVERAKTVGLYNGNRIYDKTTREYYAGDPDGLYYLINDN